MQIPSHPPYPNFTLSVVQQSLQQALANSEINIYDTYYKDSKLDFPLHVRCNLDKLNYHSWLGFCSNCAMDHEIKYQKMGKSQIYIKVQKQLDLRALDISRFSQGLLDYLLDQYQAIMTKLDPQKTSFGSFSNQFPVMAKPNDQCFTELLSSKQEGLQIKINELYNANCGETLFKKQFLAFSSNHRNIKCLCPTGKMENWLGYCEQCKLTGHPLYLVCQNQNQQLCSENKFKIIDFLNMNQKVNFEFKQQEILKININCRMIQKFIVYRMQSTNIEVWSQYNQIKEKKKKTDQIMNEQFNKLEELRNQQTKKQNDKSQNSDMSIHKGKDDTMAQKVLRPQLKIDTFYDVVISCDSILNLTAGKGWEIYVNNENYEEKKKQNTIIVSFYGLYNKGKTFKQLPRGYSVNTVGLSALYPQDFHKENSIVFLDSAGTETPISYQKEDEIIQKHLKQIIQDNNLQDMKFHERKRRVYELKLKDRLLKEFILQKYILTMSNVVMIVVDQLTKEEQRLIQKIKNLYEQNDIIIIHNFSKLVKIEDVKKYIQQDILDSFEVTEQHRIYSEVALEGKYYVEKRFTTSGSKLQDITHVIMAHHDSFAGKSYNPFCYHYLINRIRAITQAKKFDIVEKLLEMLKTTIPEIVDVTPDEINAIQIQQENNYITSNLNTTNLKSISFDLLGDLKVFKGGLDPKYSMIMNSEYLILEVEVCGSFQAAEHDQKTYKRRIIEFEEAQSTIFEWHGKRFRKNQTDKIQYIMLRGIKIEDTPNEENKLHYSDREKGDFRLVIPINPNQCVLRDNLPKANLKHGVLQFIYELQQNTEYVDLF